MNADLRGAVASATAGSTPAIRGRRTLRALVVAEFALASLMFVCGGLLVRAYDRVRNVDPGFTPDGVLTFTRVAAGRDLCRQRGAPGVLRSARGAAAHAAGRDRRRRSFRARRSAAAIGASSIRPRARPRAAPTIRIPIILNRVASAGYFETMGIRLRHGRFFNEQDGREGADQPRRHRGQRAPSRERCGPTARIRSVSAFARARRRHG